jgi:hypothetical protein
MVHLACPDTAGRDGIDNPIEALWRVVATGDREIGDPGRR